MNACTRCAQVSAFLAGLLRSKQGNRALIVAPKTLLAHWEKELRAVGLGSRVYWFYGSNEGERNAALAAVCRCGEPGHVVRCCCWRDGKAQGAAWLG